VPSFISTTHFWRILYWDISLRFLCLHFPVFNSLVISHRLLKPFTFSHTRLQNTKYPLIRELWQVLCEMLGSIYISIRAFYILITEKTLLRNLYIRGFFNSLVIKRHLFVVFFQSRRNKTNNLIHLFGQYLLMNFKNKYPRNIFLYNIIYIFWYYIRFCNERSFYFSIHFGYQCNQKSRL